jgi:lysophospholipase L1-like esterase
MAALAAANGSNSFDQMGTFSTVISTADVKVALYGDSISAQNTGVAARFEAYGYMVAAQVLNGNRFIFDHTLNKGSSGQNTTQLNTDKVTALGSLDFDICIVLCGTNDVGSSVATSTITSNLASVYDYIINTLGKKVLAISVLPRNDTPMSAAQKQSIKDVNAFIATQQSANLWFANCYDDFNDGNDEPKAGYTYDGLHPSAIGAYYMGKRVNEILIPYYGTRAFTLSGSNIMANTNLAGPGLTSASYTGNLAESTGAGITGYTFTSVGTADPTDRIFSYDGGVQVMAFDFEGGLTAAEGFRVGQRIDAVYTTGHIAYAEVELEVLSGSGDWFNLSMELRRNNAEATIGYDKRDANSNFPYDELKGRKIIVRSPEYSIPASTTRLDWRINIESDNTASASFGSFKVHNAQLVVRAP